jgi:hypothetical protein
MRLRLSNNPAEAFLRLSVNESVAENEGGDWLLDDEEKVPEDPTTRGFP